MPHFNQERLLTKIETSPLAFLLEEVATGPDVHIGTILHQEPHTLQASLLDGDVQGTMTSVVLICALSVDQGLRIARLPVNLQQWQDAGIDPISKIQDSLH